MSETPIGDETEADVMQATETVTEDVVVMESPYAIPGEEPEGWEPNDAHADDQDDQVEQSDNSGEEGDDAPQDPTAVQDNAAELDGDEPDPDGQE